MFTGCLNGRYGFDGLDFKEIWPKPWQTLHTLTIVLKVFCLVPRHFQHNRCWVSTIFKEKNAKFI